MSNTDKLMQRIKDSGDQPIPKWKFVLKRSIIWFSFGFAVIAGSLAFSVILFSLRETGFWALQHLDHSGWEMVLSLLPFIWLIALLIFLLVAIYSIQSSDKGYKLTLSKWVGYSAAISIVLGTIFYLGGGGQWLENTFASKASFYESVQEKKARIWMQPENGLLAGTLTEIKPDALIMKDFNGKSWVIKYEDAFIAPVLRLEEGEEVKLVGNIKVDNTFLAEEIRPWQGRKKSRQPGR